MDYKDLEGYNSWLFNKGDLLMFDIEFIYLFLIRADSE